MVDHVSCNVRERAREWLEPIGEHPELASDKSTLRTRFPRRPGDVLDELREAREEIYERNAAQLFHRGDQRPVGRYFARTYFSTFCTVANTLIVDNSLIHCSPSVSAIALYSS